MNTIQPLVSVGVASYNNGLYIRDTLNGIAGQTYNNIEIIIVDDCSTDDSVQVIEQWILDYPNLNARLITNKSNGGTCVVYNRILNEANGQYLSTVGSDDIYMPDKIMFQMKVLQQLPVEYAICYSDIVLIDSSGEYINGGQSMFDSQSHPEGNVLSDLLSRNFIPAMGQLARTAACREVGGFDEQLAFEDWDMWLRLARRYKVKYVPGVVAKYRIHGRSAMATRAQALLESCLILVSKHLGVSAATDEVAHAKLTGLACELYVLGGPTAGMWLGRTWKWKPSGRSTLYAAMAKAGISYPQAAGMWRKMRGLLGVSKAHLAV